MAKEKILVVEDEADIQELIRYNLVKEGYHVSCLSSGEECLKQIQTEDPDLILLDIMLPGVDGFEVCRELRRSAKGINTPIVILTAKGEDIDVVTGLELGADDYVTKPFSPRVLVARVRSILRRRRLEREDQKGVLKIHGITIDTDRHQVSIEDQVLVLTNTEFRILQLLAQSPGKVFTRDLIVERVHGDDYPVTARSIDVQIVNLRRKLGELGQLIETIRSVGYRMKE